MTFNVKPTGQLMPRLEMKVFNSTTFTLLSVYGISKIGTGEAGKEAFALAVFEEFVLSVIFRYRNTLHR